MKRKAEGETKPKQMTLDGFLNVKKEVEWNLLANSRVLYGKFGSIKDSYTKVAGFDFDNTIATVKGDYVFPKDGNDWKWFDENVPAILAYLHQNGYLLAIFSNQLNIEKGDKSALKRKQTFVGRIEKSCKELRKYCESKDIETPPILIFAATHSDVYRKPRTGMWNIFENMFPQWEINKSESFYCGDAAGRHWKPKNALRKDHTDTDRKWAMNLGMPFYVPQNVFDNQLLQKYEKLLSLHLMETPKLPDFHFDPRNFPQGETCWPNLSEFDLVICVGSPASGKSNFCQKQLSDFVRINQDNLKTLSKCEKEANAALLLGKKVVIDNTNPRKITRLKYISMARGKKIACVWFTTEMHVCIHNNLYREYSPILKFLNNLGPEAKEENQKHVPQIAMNSYWSNFEKPTKDEGYDEIFEVAFSPTFEDETEEFIWRKFYD